VGDGFYGLRDGTPVVQKLAATGRVNTLTTLRPGQHFGDLALLQRKQNTRKASVRALTPAHLLRFQAADFHRLLQSSRARWLGERLEFLTRVPVSTAEHSRAQQSTAEHSRAQHSIDAPLATGRATMRPYAMRCYARSLTLDVSRARDELRYAPEGLVQTSEGIRDSLP